jgi:phytoene synthase
MDEAYAHCAALVREADKDRFLTSLFVPAERWPHVHALLAFNAEVARVRERARTAPAGEIRLQWWLDVVAGEAAGDAARNPVALALLDTIERYELPRATLAALIEARTFDLYDDPMPTQEALEHYLRATSSALFGLVARMLGGPEAASANAAYFAGLAYGMTGLLRALPLHASRGQVYLPRELLENHAVASEKIVSGRASPGLAAALAKLREAARGNLARARAQLASVSTMALPAFLPLALVEPYLARMERVDYEPFRTPAELPQWRRQWILWRAARRGI